MSSARGDNLRLLVNADVDQGVADVDQEVADVDQEVADVDQEVVDVDQIQGAEDSATRFQ